jgi:hypothetical protein
VGDFLEEEEEWEKEGGFGYLSVCSRIEGFV